MTPLADPALGKPQLEAPGLGAEHLSRHCPTSQVPLGSHSIRVATPWALGGAGSLALLHVGRIKLFPAGCSGTCSSSGSRAPGGRGGGQREAHFSPLVLRGKNRSQLEKGAKENKGCLSNPLLCLLSTTHPRMPRPGNLESCPRQTL